jgi:putative sporulation protein YtaF
MLLNCILIAICVSIDALGIGLTYGLKNTKISFSARIVLFVTAVIMSSLSVIIGNSINKMLPSKIANIIGCLVLVLIGLWLIIQAVTNNKKKIKKEYHFFIKFLGITVQIIRDPNSSDLNNSNQIEAKEAIYLGIALSLDSVAVGLGGNIIGLTSFIYPILVGIFQLLFLFLGKFLGRKAQNISYIPENIWSIMAGCLLIFLGISKFIF